MHFYLKPGAIYNDDESYAVCLLLPNKLDVGQHVHVLSRFSKEKDAAAFVNYLNGGEGKVSY